MWLLIKYCKLKRYCDVIINAENVIIKTLTTLVRNHIYNVPVYKYVGHLCSTTWSLCTKLLKLRFCFERQDFSPLYLII